MKEYHNGFYRMVTKFKGKDIIMVIVDKFIKYTHFIIVTYSFIAQDIAQVCLDHFYKIHLLPATIITNKNKIFTNLF
jgi:hypothetical protein